MNRSLTITTIVVAALAIFLFAAVMRSRTSPVEITSAFAHQHQMNDVSTTAHGVKPPAEAETAIDLSAPQSALATKKTPASNAGKAKVVKVMKTEDEWRKELTPEQFYVLRQKGTERAFTGAYHDHKGKGVYVCAACGQELFSSQNKFDSGTGWPSFWTPMAKANVTTEKDHTLGMERTEALCSRCGGHLGHVFDDGPEPTGLRYCINSVSLKFVEK